jgi:IS5 family transposase
MKPSDLARVVIHTTVQLKAVMFPTDAKLINRARERLVRLAKKLDVSLRQSYRRVGKLALIKHQRYAHAHQFKRQQELTQAQDLPRPCRPRHRAAYRR